MIGQRVYLRMVTLILAVAITFVFAVADIAASRTCTQEEAMKAETEASSLKSWNEVYNSYRRYWQCDDASIGEGYSDSVVRLLVEDWPRVETLNQLCARNKNFERFVLGHIDELMTDSQARRMYANAKSHCPKDASRLCKEIVSRIIATPPGGIPK